MRDKPVLPEGWDIGLYRKAMKRVQPPRSSDNLYDWADEAVTAIGYNLSEQRAGRHPDGLRQVEVALHALWAVVTELRSRFDT